MAGPVNPSSKSTRPGTFFTPGRVVLSLAAVGFLIALGVSSCNSNETPAPNAPANRVTVTANPGSRSNVPNAPPPGLVPVPEEVRNTKLQTLDGESV